MFQSLYCLEATWQRHCEGPFAAERERYLRHCLAEGATHNTLRSKGTALLWDALHIEHNDCDGVDMARLQEILSPGPTASIAVTTIRHRINVARPWLRFLGWWRSPKVEPPFRDQLDRYVAWMRDERGFSASTVQQWQSRVGMFLRWCGQTNRQLKTLRPSDIDEYFVTIASQRWCRVSVGHMACALRVFLRHAATLNECDPRARHQRPRQGDSAGLRRLLDFLSERGDTAAPTLSAEVTPVEQLANEFTVYLRHERVLAATTIASYVPFADAWAHLQAAGVVLREQGDDAVSCAARRAELVGRRLRRTRSLRR